MTSTNEWNSYRRLAQSLDALPNGFPPADDESDLRLLAKIFTPEEADLAAELLPEMETVSQVAARTGRDARTVGGLLKDLSKKGIITVGKTDEGRLGFGIMPFVVGIYEAHSGKIDAELARLFEDYFYKAFGKALELQPQVHRVIPIGETIKNNMEVQPYESATALIDRMSSWGVIDCICRTQKALIGQRCGHPLDVCMVFSNQPGAFDGDGSVRALTRDEAVQTLRRASEAGLVHCVNNNQQDLWYICNCCTCSCGILRGMADLGIANVVARSAFVNTVDESLCSACGECEQACSFKAITVDDVAHINEIRCTGCGVCVLVCPQDALVLIRRAGEPEPPLREEDWRLSRKAAR